MQQAWHNPLSVPWRQHCASPAAAPQAKPRQSASKPSISNSSPANAGARASERSVLAGWTENLLSWLGWPPTDARVVRAGQDGIQRADPMPKAIVRPDGRDQARAMTASGGSTGSPSAEPSSSQASGPTPKAATHRNSTKADSRQNVPSSAQADLGNALHEKPSTPPGPDEAVLAGEIARVANSPSPPVSPAQPAIPQPVIDLDKRLAALVCAPIPYGVADIEERLLHQWVVLRRSSLFPQHPFILAYEYHCGNAALNFRGDLLLWDGKGESVLAVELKYLGVNAGEKLKKVREQAAKAEVRRLFFPLEIFLLDYLMRLHEVSENGDGDDRKRAAHGSSSSAWNRISLPFPVTSFLRSRGSAVITNEIRNCPPWSSLSDKARALLQQDYDEFCTGTVVVNQLSTRDDYLNKPLATVSEELLPVVTETMAAPPSSPPEPAGGAAEDDDDVDDDLDETVGDIARPAGAKENSSQVSPAALCQVVADVGSGTPITMATLASALAGHPEFGGRNLPAGTKRGFYAYAGMSLKQFLRTHPDMFSMYESGKGLMVALQPGWQKKREAEA
eukprot:jgi/Mesvir1/6901/Mv09061-RA.1